MTHRLLTAAALAAALSALTISAPADPPKPTPRPTPTPNYDALISDWYALPGETSASAVLVPTRRDRISTFTMVVGQTIPIHFWRETRQLTLKAVVHTANPPFVVVEGEGNWEPIYLPLRERP